MALISASCHTLTAAIGKHILDKLQFRNSLEKYAQRFFTIDITVKTDRVHFVSKTAQYFISEIIENGIKNMSMGMEEGMRRRGLKAGRAWNYKGNAKLKNETGNDHRSGKTPQWEKFEQTGAVWSKECNIKLVQQLLNKVKVVTGKIGSRYMERCRRISIPIVSQWTQLRHQKKFPSKDGEVMEEILSVCQ